MVNDDLIQSLRDRSPVAVLSASADGLVTGWSPGAQRLLAYTAEEVVGRPFPSLAQEPPQLERALARVRRADALRTICLNTHLIGKDAQQAAVFLCVDALRDDGREVQGFLVTARELHTVAFELATDAQPARITVPDASALAGLTPRQRLVLELMSRGHSTREIAKRLGRSVKTVETHRGGDDRVTPPLACAILQHRLLEHNVKLLQ